MEYRIAKCEKCGKEYKNVMDKYGEQCDCGNDLTLYMKVVIPTYSCSKSQGWNISKRCLV